MFGSWKKDPATKLRILMDARNLNEQELSWKSGISINTISRLRNGHVDKPRTETIYAIAKALNVRPNDIWRDA